MNYYAQTHPEDHAFPFVGQDCETHYLRLEEEEDTEEAEEMEKLKEKQKRIDEKRKQEEKREIADSGSLRLDLA